MSSDNQITLVGTATVDPTLRFTPGGKPLASFGIARNNRRKDGDKWVDGEPEFYDVTVWGSLAENVAESVEKGTRVIVSGRLQYRAWEKDGAKRSKVDIVADEVGPSLRWATCDIQKTERSDKAVSQAKANLKEAFDPSEEPF